MTQFPMFAYVRSDGVFGFGFQINPYGLPENTDEEKIHHSVTWPDRPCQRFSKAMLENQKINVLPAVAMIGEGTSAETVVAMIGSLSDDEVDKMNEALNDPSNIAPLQVAAEPTVTNLGSASSIAEAVNVATDDLQSGGSSDKADPAPGNSGVPSPGSELVDPVNVVFVKLCAVEVDPALTDERAIQVLLRAVPEAENADVIKHASTIGIQVTDQFVTDQRIEVDRQAAADQP